MAEQETTTEEAQETAEDAGAQADGADTTIGSVSVGNANVDTATVGSPSVGSVQVGDGGVAIVVIESLDAPSEVQQGDEYTVSATLVNVGNEAIAKQTSYRIAGNVVEADLVEVPARGATAVTFEVSVGQFPAGDYTHGVYTDGARTTAQLSITASNQTQEINTEQTTTEAEGTTTAADGETAETTTTAEA